MTRRCFKAKYPAATMAFYGPDDVVAAEVVVAIIASETSEGGPMRRWSPGETDVCEHKRIGEEIALAFRLQIAPDAFTIVSRCMLHRRQSRRSELWIQWASRFYLLPTGGRITLSPGGQNPLVKAFIEQFCPRFVPGGVVLYAGDAESKFQHFDRKCFEDIDHAADSFADASVTVWSGLPLGSET